MSRVLESLPDIITAGELAEYLSISKRKAYELMEISEDIGGIPCLQFGRNKRVEKVDLLTWIEKNKN